MTPVLLSLVLFATTDQARNTVTIKSLTIAGPVAGGNLTHGRVEIESLGPVPQMGTVSVSLSTDNGIAVCPPAMPVDLRTKFVDFNVGTFPVNAPTDVTFTAKVGTSSKTAKLQVNPVKLAAITCAGNTVVPATPLKCTASLDGGPPQAITVALSTTLSVLSVPATVTINKGTDKSPFDAKAEPIAQSAPVQITGTYAGVSKSFAVTVLPVALDAISIAPDSTVPGSSPQGIPMLSITLTAPPPAAGLKVKLSSQVTASHGDSNPVTLPASVTLTHQTQKFSIEPRPVASETWVAINASSDFFNDIDKKSATLKVTPAPLHNVQAIPNNLAHLPLGGRAIQVFVALNGTAPDAGASVDIQYTGDTPIAGPNRVEIVKGTNYKQFSATVSPCSIKPTCTSFITARYLGGQKHATVTIDQ